MDISNTDCIDNTDNTAMIDDTAIDETIRVLEMLIEPYDNNIVSDIRSAHLCLALGSLYRRRGDPQKARNYYQKANDWVKNSKVLEIFVLAKSLLTELEAEVQEIDECTRDERLGNIKEGYKLLAFQPFVQDCIPCEDWFGKYPSRIPMIGFCFWC